MDLIMNALGAAAGALAFELWSGRVWRE